MARDQIARLGEVAGGRRVPDCLVDLALGAVPGAGAPVQLRRERRLGARELVAEQVAKQMVVPVPAPTIVERDQKQVRPLNLL